MSVVKITFEGQTRSIGAWALRKGLNHTTLRSRIDGGWPLEQAFSAPPARGRFRMVEFDGRTQSVTAWAKETGIPFKTLHFRLTKCGWTIERALKTPLRTKKSKPQ